MEKGYDKALAKEWIDWVETPGAQGARAQEILPFIRNWLKETEPKVLADIGCGQGQCSELVDASVEYIGIDPSHEMIKRAKHLFSHKNKQFIEGNAYKIPLKDRSVDAAMSIWVWSHLDDIETAAREMFRVLENGGRFLIITANPETYEERKTFYKSYTIKGNLLIGTFDLGDGKVLTDTILCLHSKKQIEDAIKHAGLKINHIKRIGQAETSNNGLYLAIEGSK